MELNEIRPVQSIEQATRRRSASQDGAKSGRPRHQFSRVFGESEGVVYRVIDEETGMILTQVPSEEVLRVAKRLQEMLSERKAK